MKKAWVITADMGYGHQRAAYPLKDIAYIRIIDINRDELVPERERKAWVKAQRYYEWISRVSSVPLIGEFLFNIYDRAQRIAPLFPLRDLSKPTYWTRFTTRYIKRKKFCVKMAEIISKTDYPIVTTFPIIAIALSYQKMKNEIYCVVTDSDINRIWVSENPKRSKITYFTPCKHVSMRLKEYGVPDDKIILTGFPLPKENIGGSSATLLKYDIKNRILNLDPKRRFINLNKPVLKKYLEGNIPKRSNHKLTITYMVGGAGAQKENGVMIAKSLKARILKNKINLILVAGTRKDVKKYFEMRLKMIGLDRRLGKNLKILYSEKKTDYFRDINSELRKTDLIWTKPSEMSFFAALGIPIVMTKPLGAHEGYNKEWLEHLGAGIKENDPRYTDEWLYYWLESGRLAHAAFDGFTEALTMGTYNIESVLDGRSRKMLFEK